MSGMTAARSTALDRSAQLGLRERKKLKTRIAIRQAAYRLIAEQGYDATTVEQIAAAAEVSPSTVFRYFPTKEDIVLTDEWDPMLIEGMRARPQGEPVLDSLRAVLHDSLRSFTEADRQEMIVRTGLMAEVPAVKARMMESMSVTGRMFGELVAERSGRAADDLDVRVAAMAVFAALNEVTVHWAQGGHKDDIFTLIDRALDVLGNGLRL